ncbi:alpha-galactosidase [Paenibacillus aurantius]|uniref:Alpha-galactosidase n=1 Tax=Paenibacillus aurantius TaxID=2918900 RepID=A0AA96RCJ4_9BACL|nr:alpha-galactosidase [Paenibacillus aurantius]WNQ10615.1 alpha-galactosidase [Paenibacillus aurantius]
MAVHFDGKANIYHLQTKSSSYLFQVTKWGTLAHLYWGKRIRPTGLDRILQLRARSAASPTPDVTDKTYSPDTIPQEYPGYGAGDFRLPAFQVQLENGSTVTDLKYRAHRLLNGKPKLEGLPATYAEAPEEAETLEIELADEVIGLKVILTYTVFEHYDAITRSVRFAHEGPGRLKLLRTMSMSVDMSSSDYDLLQLSGAVLRERHLHRRALVPGTQSIESRRGASGHQQNPFMALLSKGADEDSGDVYGFSLVYSGSFLASAEVEQFGTTRVSLGINPFDFSWLLEPGESFQTPETVLVYSDRGLGGMSRTYHRLYRERLCRGTHRDRERPVLVNNWEATYFDFNADKLGQIAKVGGEIGIELFVLDDGWFGRRDNDKSSLGDWFVDRNKLPEGLEHLAERISANGLAFGLWFEPEMISPDSELYRSHPDWCLHVPDRSRTTSRNQLVLDYSRADVRDYIVDTVGQVLSSAPIRYVKWDMNRNMTEIGSALLPPDRQRETAHRYMLGLYDVLERITSAFPDVLFESCAAGGGRFDPGLLHYMPQVWTSDNSDAVMRLKVQYGTSLVYPPVTMGAHVSAVPNHQVGRITPLKTRGYVAMSGNLGYELDLTRLTEDDKTEIRSQIELYKQIRPLVQFGDHYRLRNPFEGNETAWMFVSADRQEAAAFYFETLSEAAPAIKRLKLKGLDPNLDYMELESGAVYGGDHLMYVGIPLPVLKGDFLGVMFRLQAVSQNGA